MRVKQITELVLSLPKTIFFNFKYFTFKQAIKLPVLVSRKTYLMDTNGEILIEEPRPFGVRIGFGQVGIFDNKKSRSIWQVKGKVIFKGTAIIGHGSKVSVNKTGCLKIGNGFQITAESSIVCSKEIEIGDGVLMSWDNLIMDTDFHSIVDDDGQKLNHDKKVIIDDNVWIGCRCTILKGSEIPNGSIIAANSLIANKFIENNTIIGGNPSKILKVNVNWIKHQ